MAPPLRTVHHICRYRQILSVFIKHGFGFALDYLGLMRPHIRLTLRHPTEIQITEAIASHIRLALEGLGLSFVKLGQIFSTRPDLLPPVYIAELSKLQDSVPPAPWEEVQLIIIQDFGSEMEQAFAKLDPEPMAAASLAQVQAAQAHGGEDVIVKVQRPGVIDFIQTDLEVDYASVAQRTPIVQVHDPVGIVDDFAFTLRNELEYRREGCNADRFRTNFKDEAHIYLSRVYWKYSTFRILVLERINGIKIDYIVGIDREVVTRSLSAVTKKGSIDMKDDKQILIRDEGKLHHICDLSH